MGGRQMKFRTLALAGLAWLAAAAAPAEPAHPLESHDLEAWLDGMVPFALDNGDIAGAVVSVVKDGKVLFEKGYGYADVEHKTAMDPDGTLMRVGSTSKLFTWTAVMQLVEQGKLDLDRDVNDYLDFKIAEPFGKKITLLDLMHHRGGFEEGLKDVLMTDPAQAPSTEDYLKKHPRPMLFAPGAVPAYSNYGTALAGYIVQRVSGEPFERYVVNHIFAPLGMRHSSFEQPVPEDLRADVATGYRTASGPARPFEIVTTAPAGALSATASDMAKFMLAHLQDGQQILRPETAKLMHAPSEEAPSGFGTMAHGFFHEKRNGHLLLGHGGDTIVFHSDLELLPDDGVGIFVSFNSRGREDSVYATREALIHGFVDRYFPAASASTDAPALASAARDVAEIAGTYDSSRRIEDGFLSVFYLLQQTTIAANPDGTISMPGRFGLKTVTFREVAPKTWHELGGPRILMVGSVDGVKTVTDSEDPTSVLQAARLVRSAGLNVPVMLGSAAILAATLLFWPFSAFLSRGNPTITEESRKLHRSVRLAVLVLAVYAGAWVVWLMPVLSIELGNYNYQNDWIVRCLQLSGLAAIAAAIWAIWSTLKLVKLPVSLVSKIWTVAIALAGLGVVWIGFIGHLIGTDLNY
jgi:CubicO group peptidase (beta-lactamase class C family)